MLKNKNTDFLEEMEEALASNRDRLIRDRLAVTECLVSLEKAFLGLNANQKIIKDEAYVED